MRKKKGEDCSALEPWPSHISAGPSSPFGQYSVQLLHELSISAKGSSVKLLKVIKNPLTDHLPTGCRKIGKISLLLHPRQSSPNSHLPSFPPLLSATSYQAKNLVKLPQYAPTVAPDGPVCFVVGAIAHGNIDVPWCDESVAISQYAMSAAGVCAKLTDAFEQAWGVH